MEHKTNLAYVKRGCGTLKSHSPYSAAGKTTSAAIAVYVIILSGVLFQVAFVWTVTAVLVKMLFKDYAQKTFTYSYDMYGMFWGFSTSALWLLGLSCSIYTTTAVSIVSKNLAPSWKIVFPILVAMFLVLVVEVPVAIYAARKATVAVPCIFKYPATLLCCGRKRPAERLVTTIVLWVDLAALQMMLFQGYIIILTLTAAPFAVVANVMLVVLALSCLTNFFSLLYTIFAHLCTPSKQRVHSSSMVLRAVVVLPLLLMIICHGIVIAAMGSVTNVDGKRKNSLSFINSIATPILLGVISIFLKRLISAWLKWSPYGTEQETVTDSPVQTADEELLGP